METITLSAQRQEDLYERHMQWRVSGRWLVALYVVCGVALAVATPFSPSVLVGVVLGALALMMFSLAARIVRTLRETPKVKAHSDGDAN